MFENRQDTTLFRDSLVSAINYLVTKKQSNGSNSHEDEEEALKIVVSTVSSLTCNLYGVDTVSELFEKQLDFSRRCHSVAFIALLRSLGIACSEADAYYESILHYLPDVDFHFYLKLNSSCHWSEYFIECVQQLETDSFVAVLKKLLAVKCEGELKYYVWHLTLQSVIWKIFTMECPYLLESEKLPSFQFKFHIPDSLLEAVSEKERNLMKKHPLGQLSQVYNILSKLLSQEAAQKIDNINYVKVVFHAFKTLFRLIIKIEDGEGPYLEGFKDLSSIFVQCLTQKSAVSSIIKSLSECNQCAIDLSYLTLSWEISELYLVFTLQSLWRDLTAYFLKHTFGYLPLYYTKFRSLMEKNMLSWKFLKDLIDQYLSCSDDAKKKYCLLLKCVVNNHYPCTSWALEYFISNADLWEPYKVIDLLEKNLSSLDPFIIYESLAYAIVNSSSDQKCRLLKCFYNVLAQAPVEMYDIVLKHVVNKWGYCEHLKLPEYDSEIIQFTRKTLTLKEAEQILPALFVQSPNETLKSLIEQALMQGADGIKMLEVLSIIRTVCLHEFSGNLEYPLINLLSHYFEDNLSTLDAKNFVLIIKSLAELEIKHGKIFPFDFFCNKCILPNLSPCDSSKIELTLECLYVYLEVLMPNYGDKISCDNFADLIKHLGVILTYCLENGIVKLKETVISILDLFATSKTPFRLTETLAKSPFTENYMVTLYVLRSFLKRIPDWTHLKLKEKLIGEESKLLWIWCCINSDDEIFKEKIKAFGLSYENLLTVLKFLFPHLTKAEWVQSTKLIAYYLKLLNIKESDYPWLLPDGDPELYSIIRCLIDCFTIIIQEKSSKDCINISSSLVNTIMNLLNKTTIPSPLLLNVFLDVCQLVSLLDTEIIYIFSSLLMSLRKKFISNCDMEIKEDCIKLLEFGIDSLPDSQEKSSLMEKMITEV